MEISNLTKKRIKEGLKENSRFDGRDLLEHREIEIETGISENAEGSARVKFGKTEVIVGVKLGLATPYPDSPDEGTLKTVMELLPLSSPEFEPGPPRIQAIEISRIIDRGIRESGFIDFKKLCIEEGEKVYEVYLDIFSINNDGNLLDAGFLGALAAFKDARMPEYDAEEEKIIYENKTDKTFPLTDIMPFNITFYKIGDNFIIDPVTEEEEASESRISLGLTEDKEKIKINSIQKGKEGTMTEEELSQMIDASVKKFKELKKEFDKKVK